MKKVLLSLSMLAATVFAANAQSFTIWNAATGTGFAGAGSAFKFNDNATFTVDTAATAPHTITANGTTAGYYVSGFGNGAYSETGTPQSLGYTAANFATDKFFMNVKAPGTAIKVQFTTFTNGVADADQYGYSFDMSAAPNAFADKSINMSMFSKLAGANSTPNGVNFLTSALAAKIGKIEFAINYQANSGIGTANVQLRNITIGSTALSTTSAAANITSTKVFPNPTTGQFTAEIVVKNNASVNVIVSDMMGKQVASKAVANGSASFETAGLVAGMYTVTYVVNGTPAKTELVVVK